MAYMISGMAVFATHFDTESGRERCCCEQFLTSSWGGLLGGLWDLESGPPRVCISLKGARAQYWAPLKGVWVPVKEFGVPVG